MLVGLISPGADVSAATEKYSFAGRMDIVYGVIHSEKGNQGCAATNETPSATSAIFSDDSPPVLLGGLCFLEIVQRLLALGGSQLRVRWEGKERKGKERNRKAGRIVKQLQTYRVYGVCPPPINIHRKNPSQQECQLPNMNGALTTPPIVFSSFLPFFFSSFSLCFLGKESERHSKYSKHILRDISGKISVIASYIFQDRVGGI